jgi:hypothetical protein
MSRGNPLFVRHYLLHVQLALRAISFANVRVGILPALLVKTIFVIDPTGRSP